MAKKTNLPTVNGELPYDRIVDMFTRVQVLYEEIDALHDECKAKMHEMYGGVQWFHCKEYEQFIEDSAKTFGLPEFNADMGISRSINTALHSSDPYNGVNGVFNHHTDDYKRVLEDHLNESNLTEEEKQAWRDRADEVYNTDLLYVKNADLYRQLRYTRIKMKEANNETFKAPEEFIKATN